MPALERIGRHDDLPGTGGANQHLHLVGVLTNTSVGNSIHGIVIHVVAWHAGVFVFHGRSWSNVGQDGHYFVVSCHHDLFDGFQIRTVQSGGGIGPAEMHLEVGRRGSDSREIGGHRWRLVVDLGRHKIEHGIGGMRVGRVINEVPAIGAATPTQVEVEHVVVVVSITNEGVAAAVLAPTIVHRPAHVELLAHHSLPGLGLIVVAAELHDGIAVVEILIHDSWNRA